MTHDISPKVLGLIVEYPVILSTSGTLFIVWTFFKSLIEIARMCVIFAMCFV